MPSPKQGISLSSTSTYRHQLITSEKAISSDNFVHLFVIDGHMMPLLPDTETSLSPKGEAENLTTGSPSLPRKWNTRSHLVYLSDVLCNSSSAEKGVLMAITGHSPTPTVGGKHYHRQRASPNHYCTHQGSETPLNYPAISHPRTHGAPQRDIKIV
ncbi:hypothetical protein AVEN_31853-1 [Araneus ventricosus]|uniref:Uncharacterized protein n=1 Tax=Araneus ventricosus TaxID=182803 RepID=A0A4Y2F6N9_ARAVE|nr:hypothetical protein AVEN_31853-1 [Araneus ventricosus]